jgi:hypothetical protein
MKECHKRVFFIIDTPMRLTTMHMLIASGLAGIKPCGSMLRVKKYFHLSMRRRLAGHPSQGKRHHMKCMVQLAPNIFKAWDHHPLQSLLRCRSQH